jgi:peptidoglycan hydrolase-like protein with peptidoglycan-binding domain
VQTSDSQAMNNASEIEAPDAQVSAEALINKPLLQQGSRGEAVKELQNLLAHWAIYTAYKGPFDGIFTQEVKRAVIAYQHQMFLVEDGIVGSLTWQALYKGAPVNMPVLREGSKGNAVITLQNVLKITGDYRNTVDGNFGPRTKTAVQAFQKRVGLVVDGIVGDRTWQALSKVPH